MTERLMGGDPTGFTGGEALVGLVRASLRVGVVVAAVVMLGSFLDGGTAGAVTALVTAVVLLGLHVGSGVVTARLAADRPLAMPGITLAALLLRLVVYGILLAVFSGNQAVDVVALAAMVLALTFTMLIVESFLVARYSRYWWASPMHAPEGATEAAPSRATERTGT